MNLSDEELVSKCLSGEMESFGQLVLKYQGIVRGLAFHLVGDFEDAKDLAQETFIRAYVRLPELKDRGMSWRTCGAQRIGKGIELVRNGELDNFVGRRPRADRN